MESLLPHPTLDAIIERLTDEGLIGMHEAAAILKRHPATLTRWALRPDECRRAWRSLMSDEARLAAVLAGAKGNGGAYAALGRAAGRPEADYYLEPDHPLTPRLIRAAKHYPAAFAMSHQAHVNFGDRNGRKVVESFKPGRAIISVDVVDRGGTTGGLFEHAPPLPVKSASPDPWELVREAGDGGMRLTPSRLQALRGIGSRSSRAAFIREQAAIDRQFAAAAVAEQSARASAAGIEAARRRAAQYARQFQEVPS